MKERRTEVYSVELHRNALTDEIERELWFDSKTGKAHRPNGPADIQYYERDGRRCRSDTYYKQGTVYRESDLPSVVVLDEETGVAILQEWNVGPETSRLGGKPAVIATDWKTGVVEREEYWEHGRRHRVDGPAYIERDPQNGQKLENSYFDRGEEIDPNHGPGPSPE